MVSEILVNVETSGRDGKGLPGVIRVWGKICSRQYLGPSELALCQALNQQVTSQKLFRALRAFSRSSVLQTCVERAE